MMTAFEEAWAIAKEEPIVTGRGTRTSVDSAKTPSGRGGRCRRGVPKGNPDTSVLPLSSRSEEECTTIAGIPGTTAVGVV